MTNKSIALVTGATSGIGQAIAQHLHDRDYEVFAVGRNPAALDELRRHGLRACALDVTDESAVDRLVDEIDAEYGGVDVLVNNAGFGQASPMEQVTLSDLRSILETNLVAMLHLSQAVLPVMRARGTGTIVNIGSIVGRFTTPGAGAYHISKYGVEALSLAMRAEVRPFGVRVALIEPTGVRNTKFVAALHRATFLSGECDPYGEFKRRYDEVTCAMADAPLMTVDADTVARTVIRVTRARNPRPRYIVGLSGRASLLARCLLSDQMWDRVLMKSLQAKPPPRRPRRAQPRAVPSLSQARLP